jgi:hypothetical protein
MSFFKKLYTSATRPETSDDSYRRVVEQTAGMLRDRAARKLAKRDGLDVVDVTWEDTGRFKGSAVGPNISDMAIQVQHAGVVTCMPVIRHPNFSDETADVAIDDVFLRVGNERGQAPKRVSLRAYLRDLRAHLSDAGSWPGNTKSLLSPREQEVLVSAQACLLPVPKEGRATFNPVVFNYQSYQEAPAVLAIVASREGTSATIIDNQRDGFGAERAWGQRLFFNDDGQRASFTGTRLEDFVASGGDGLHSPADLPSAKKAGLNCVLLIQVPLVQPERRGQFCLAAGATPPPACAQGSYGAPSRRRCDVDEAVIGHGATEGPFTEIDNLPIERDARFPIRITVQFYKATSNGVVDAATMSEIAAQIGAVYADAKAVGSLVTDGDTTRSTEWDDEGTSKREPADWWPRFWTEQEAATGKTRHQLLADLEKLLGRRPANDELARAIREVFGG